jgi:hypothetical protein
MKPVKVFGDYVVCFEAEPEYLDMRHHFVKECGWTQGQFAKIQDFAWFSAKVSIWKDGKELAADYLGACCYETEDEFWTTYEGDYFAEMVRHCAEELGDKQLLAQVLTWRATFKGVVA